MTRRTTSGLLLAAIALVNVAALVVSVRLIGISMREAPAVQIAETAATRSLRLPVPVPD